MTLDSLEPRIVPANTPPVANPDSYTVLHNHILNMASPGVLFNDFDPDGNPISVVSHTNPTHGALTLNSNGSFTYTPSAGYAGSDSFSYTISDGMASVSATASINVTNQPPVANPDSYTVVHDHVLSTSPPGVLFNDFDPDGDPISITSHTNPTHGSLTLNSNGSFTYTPSAGYVGSDSFSYTISDGMASVSATASINVTNQPPMANPDSYTVLHDHVLNTFPPGVLFNDSDPNGDSLAITSHTNPMHGSLTLNSNGSFTYTPSAGYAGSDSFSYTISDGIATASATVSITVTNSPPLANPDSYTVLHDHVLSVSSPGVLFNDSDSNGDPIAIVSNTNPSHGSLTLNSNGSFTYTPSAGYAGSDSFSYTISDGIATASTTVSISVTNFPPLANLDFYQIAHDQTLTVTAGAGVLANDSDLDADPISIVSNTSPTHGSLSLNSDGSFTYTPNVGYVGPDSFSYTISDGIATASATVSINVTNQLPIANPDFYTVLHDQVLNSAYDGVLANDFDPDGDPISVVSNTSPGHGSLSLNSAGLFTYTPSAGYVGFDSFSYTVSDGIATASTTVSINVTGQPQPPVANPDSYQIAHDQALTVTAFDGVLSNDYDPNGYPISVVSNTGPGHGSLSLNGDGSFTYTPNLGYVGSDSFSYTISDGFATASTTVSIVVTNQPPVANPDAYTTLHDQALTVDATIGVLANDSDPDGDLFTIVSNTNPSHGSLSLGSDGSFTYTPNAGYVGSDSFSYTISDGVATASATVSIDVTNQPPVAWDDYYQTLHDHGLTVTSASGVLANDWDPDADPISIVSNTSPTHGSLSLNGDGSFSYTPSAGYVGPDSFSYTISDGIATASATVFIDVTNQPPVAEDDFYSIQQAQVLTVAAPGVLGNDYDPDGDTLTITASTSTAHGGLIFNTDGSFVYTPDAGFIGQDTFTYTISDGADNATATVTIDITPVVPDAIDDTAFTNEETPVTIAVLSNDVTPAGTTLTVVSYTQPANGSATLNNDGTITYTPNSEFCGTDTFTYTIAAASGGPTDTATVTVDVGTVVTIAATIDTTEEGSNNPAVFTVSRTGPTTSDLTVLYTISGAASNGTDYATIPTSVVIPAGAASAVIEISALTDTLVEPPEDVVLTLVEPSGPPHVYCVGSPSSATVWITDVTIYATVVNSTGDAPALNPALYGAWTGGYNSENEPEVTHRSAIEWANYEPGKQTILFNIPTSDPGFDGQGYTIHAGSPFPAMTGPTSVNATSQFQWATSGGVPVIEVAFTSLVFMAADSNLDGEAVTNAAGAGVVVNTTGGVTIQNNFIGLTRAGAIAGNALGVHINNVGNTNVLNNVISGNNGDGIKLEGAGATNIRIQQNKIGTNKAGDAAKANQGNGVNIAGGNGNLIGGPGANDGNVISGNVQNGVRIAGNGANTNRVEGNKIGTDVNGNVAIRNQGDGVLIENGAQQNKVGLGNVISGNKLNGVHITGTNTNLNRVFGNLIGTKANGTDRLPNEKDGVLIEAGAQQNRIGRTSELNERNVISGNAQVGVRITGTNTNKNMVAGNYIGTQDGGLAAVAGQAQQDGVAIENGAQENVVGTDGDASNDAIEGNVISGNTQNGVRITGRATGATTAKNVVAGNYIGTAATGTTAVANTRDGVLIEARAQENRVGTNGDNVSDIYESNTISGNVLNGVHITGSGTNKNVVAGNLIGTDLDGLFAVRNQGEGVLIEQAAQQNIIGVNSDGSAGEANEFNVISGNKLNGVRIKDANTKQNVVAGNYLGTDYFASNPIPNEQNGVRIEAGASQNRIGTDGDNTADTAERNVISGNTFSGVNITGNNTNKNTVAGNYIGVDVTGNTALANQHDGVRISDRAQQNVIGVNGDASAGEANEGNVISGNTLNGVRLGLVQGATNFPVQQNVVAGNKIGTDAAGNNAVPNVQDGIRIEAGSQQNRIGTDADGTSDTLERNIISGNTLNGVRIAGLGNANTGANGTNGNIIAGNYIGTKANGTADLGNQRYGVRVELKASNNRIGSDDDGVRDDVEGNTIAWNGVAMALKGHGVSIDSGTGNRISQDSFFDNRGRAIDLNDAPDAQLGAEFHINRVGIPGTGANKSMDYPVLTKAVFAAGAAPSLTWTLEATPGRQYLIEFYSNTAADPSGFGEGKTLFRTDAVTTGAANTSNRGKAFVTFALPAGKQLVSAIAIDKLSGDTSEFSMVDTDSDGLADEWENNGIDMNEDGVIDYVLAGANPQFRDVYVEVDAMTPTAGVFSIPANFNNVIAAYAAAPVRNANGANGVDLHVTYDEKNLVKAAWTPANAWPNFLVLKAAKFGTPAERANALGLKAKRLVSRYAIVAHSIGGGAANGWANLAGAGLPGNMFMIAMGAQAAPGGGTGGTPNEQEGTFMHELGHTLGLRHGGDQQDPGPDGILDTADDGPLDFRFNFKPNYPSVMNYLWQQPMAAWPIFADWKLQYSEGTYNALNENAGLNENNGIGGVAGKNTASGLQVTLPNGKIQFSAQKIPENGKADFNGNGVLGDNGVKMDLNALTAPLLNGGTQVLTPAQAALVLRFDNLTDFNDWTGLQYYYWESRGTALGIGSLGAELLGSDFDEFSLALQDALARSARADFGMATSPLAESPDEYHLGTDPFDPVLGVGWRKGTVIPFDRGVGDDLTRDGVQTDDAEFDITMPEGSYNVAIISGDPTQGQGPVEVYLQDKLVDTFSTGVGQFHEANYMVSFDNDNNLVRLRIHGLSGPAFLNALTVTRAGSLPSAEIRGVVWQDDNADGLIEPGEVPLAGSLVYLDANGNGQFDADESSTETDANGQYIFTGLAAGSYQVRLSGSDEVHKVVLAHGQPVSRNFAIRPLSAVVADVSASSKGSSATVSLLANGLESQGDSLTVTGSSQGDSATALGSEKTVPDTPNAGGIGSQVVTSTASEVAASQSQQAPTVAGTAVAAESRSVTLVPSRRDQQPASGTAAASVAQATQTSEPSPGVFLVGIRGEIFGTAPAGVAELQATTLAGLVFPATTGLATDPQFSFYLKSPVPLNPPLSNRVEGTGGEGLPDPETGDENVALPAPLNEGEALGENVGMGAPTESGIWGWARDACFADGSWEDALVEQESPEWAPGPVASSAVLAMAGGMLLGTVRPPQVEERDRRRRLQSVR